MNREQVTEALDTALNLRLTPLHAELDRLAVAYIHASGDPSSGIELMCERWGSRLEVTGGLPLWAPI